MSTFIEIRPTLHASKTTTAIRLDDDFKYTVREEESDKDPEHYQYNYTGLEEGEQLDGSRVSDPTSHVRVVKLGTDARCIIGVKAYYPENEPHLVPTAGMYWYNAKTHYDPEKILREAKGEETEGKLAAPNAEFPNAAQTFPQFIFNNSSDQELIDHPLPVGNSVAVSFTSQSLFTRAGNTADRMSELKVTLRANHIDHTDFNGWLTGLNATGDYFDRDASLAGATRNYWLWLEMITRAISVNANVDNEQHFNLLLGDASLLGSDVLNNFGDPDNTGRIVINGIFGEPGPTNTRNDRSTWNFVRLGSVASSSPYAYTKPTGSNWGQSGTGQSATANQVSGINVRTDITIPSDKTWIEWLRSQ